MDKNSRIFVAGHTGLVGSAITGSLLNKGYSSLILKTKEELDLTDQQQVDLYFRSFKPEYVFLAAARVGGIMANNSYRADFIYDNLMIESNVIHSSWKYGVKKLIFMGSTCIYPRDALQPLKESSLLTSSLEYTNEPYALAKIAGLKMCESYNIQYGTNFIPVMPTNLYGPSDNYDLEKSHVLPALLRKSHLGHCLEKNDWDAIRKDLNKNPIRDITGSSSNEEILNILSQKGIIGGDKVRIVLWGTGVPLREFMYSADLAEASVFIMEKIDSEQVLLAHKKLNPAENHPPHFLNIGTGIEITIKDLSLKINNLTGFNGQIEFDNSKPDGTYRKATDTTILRSLGFSPATDLDTGLQKVYAEYINKPVTGNR